MCPFSCVLWAIFLVLSPLFFGQIARYLPITEAKMP
ncbi:unknown [Bacteroides sp. CAG:702]|nr:unknown [Bacteroides sp. CAG:702]